MKHAGLIDEFLDGIFSRIGDLFAWIPDWYFLGKWWALGLVILFAALLLSWFFGALPVIGGWLKGISGSVVVLYAAFLVGLTVAYRHYKTERNTDKEKIREAQNKPVPPPQSGDGGWKWPL
jgi:hypothetical protein